MVESTIRRRREAAGPGAGGLGDIFSADEGGLVTVSHGLHVEQLPVSDMTVAQIRGRYADRFDVDPESQAQLDGRDVGDETVVRPGQLLTFARTAGEKGTVTLEGRTARAASPEGQTASMPVEDLIERASGRAMSTAGVILPEGIRWFDTQGHITIWVQETPPRIYKFKWIAADSPARFGGAAEYRTVRLALPYLVVVAAFEGNLLSGYNECFFRVAPLSDESDELLYPALLNCSRFEPPDGSPLSWICTTKLDPGAVRRVCDPKQRMRAGLKALLQCLLETGFNYSSDEHEFSSWFTESIRVDSRIATVEAWEQATEKDPLFVLDVPWLKTGHSVKQVAERIFANQGAARQRIRSSNDLARIIFHHAH